MEESERGRRYQQNLQGLLRFVVDHNDDPQGDTASAFHEMSEEVKNEVLKLQIVWKAQDLVLKHRKLGY